MVDLTRRTVVQTTAAAVAVSKSGVPMQPAAIAEPVAAVEAIAAPIAAASANPSWFALARGASELSHMLFSEARRASYGTELNAIKGVELTLLKRRLDTIETVRHAIEPLMALPEDRLDDSWQKLRGFMKAYLHTQTAVKDGSWLPIASNFRFLLGGTDFGEGDEPLPEHMTRETLQRMQRTLDEDYRRFRKLCEESYRRNAERHERSVKDDLDFLEEEVTGYSPRRLVTDSDFNVLFSTSRVSDQLCESIQSLLDHKQLKIQMERLPEGKLHLDFTFDPGPFLKRGALTNGRKMEAIYHHFVVLKMGEASDTELKPRWERVPAPDLPASDSMDNFKFNSLYPPYIARIDVTSSDAPILALAERIEEMQRGTALKEALHGPLEKASVRRTEQPALQEGATSRRNMLGLARAGLTKALPPPGAAIFDFGFAPTDFTKAVIKEAIGQAKGLLASVSSLDGITLTPTRDGCRLVIDAPEKHPELLEQLDTKIGEQPEPPTPSLTR